ncbi:SNF2-related protein [Bacillus sp. Au-Bac7]|uniref:SNF2-related protein n=1 Tax=Bacillus sp. Au-Bac7 TaxID=2906458 RepID=UPI001E30808F|nr:SNF2-related protein [Bacillus sp. Au-Bac7]MCE4051663.1 SNF2-related protein [Bacillus sp. Au-Bac7]
MLKLQTIYENTLKKIGSNKEEWMKFLSFASRIHKYPFDQAVLVYAQNEETTMLASKEIWNKFKRQVKPESKAVQVIKYENGNKMVEHLFDLSQTDGPTLSLPIWAIQDFEKEFIAQGLSKDNLSIEDSLDTYTQKIVSNLYLSIEDHVEQTFQGAGEREQAIYLHSLFDFVVKSTQYAVREKSGLENGDFDHSFLENINSLSKMSVVGYLINQSTKSVMSEVANLKKNYILRNGRDNNELKLSEERGRASLSKHRTEQQRSTRRAEIGEIRETSHELPTREESDKIHGATNERNLDGDHAPSGSTSERENNRLDDGIREASSPAEDRRHSSANEPQKPIEKSSRGNRSSGDRISSEVKQNSQTVEPVAEETGSFLSSKPVSNNIQLDLFNDWDSVGEVENTVDNPLKEAAEIEKAEMDRIIGRGSGFQSGKYRIVEFFSHSPSNKEAEKFLKEEYGIGGWSDGPNFVQYDTKGLEIRGKESSKHFTWSKMVEQIKERINQDLYLTDKEKIAYQNWMEEKKKDKEKEEAPSIEKNQVEENIQDVEVPEVISVQNYRFDQSTDQYVNGEKSKFKNNMAAIRLLKQLEKNKAIPTPAEQKILAKYVGWGGLANVFSPDHEKWKLEYSELKALLTEREYQEALESTITAYYTDPLLIETMYEGLKGFGFTGGKILDPAMGTGNFFSVLPEDMAPQSQLTGVELDSITGRIATYLYPHADVQVKGYETTTFKDNEFDVVLGNIPFNNVKVLDSRYDKSNFLIHDYFIAKSLDVVKPGGIVAVITSKGTLDKADSQVREYLSERSELLGAVRLPNNAFKSIAGTEVTTDILFLKKKENGKSKEKANWLESKWDPTGSFHLNEYFMKNPHMILGEMVVDGYYNGGLQTTCKPKEGQDLLPALKQAIASIEGSFSAEKDLLEQKEVEIVTEQKILEAPAGIKNFTYVVQDNQLYYCEHNKLIPQQLKPKETDRIVGMSDIRDQVLKVIEIQSSPYQEEVLKEQQQQLNDIYDRFVQKYGYINDRVNQRAFFEDDQLPLLLSLEEAEADKSYRKAAIFHKATIRPQIEKEFAENAQEALEMSINKNMVVDLTYMSNISNLSAEQLIQELGSKIFLNPQSYTGDLQQGWEIKDDYLTGNVHDKLIYARLMAKEYPELFTRNVTALEDVQPARLLPGDIHFRIGSPWIPQKYYQEFMYELFGTRTYLQNRNHGIHLKYFSFSNTWKVENKNAEMQSVKVNSVFGTKRRNAYQIYEDCLNLQDSTVRDAERYHDASGTEQTKYVVNPKETMIARTKQQQVQEAFSNWLFKEPARSEELLTIYNERFNVIRPRVYDGEHLEFPGMNQEMQLRSHQKNVVARILSTGRALMAHEVGAGKTAAMIASAMKLKQIGSVNKPMFVVMNHTIDQWANEILRFYPGAKVLIATKKDFEKKNRQKFVSKIATGNYDAVIIGHSQFEKIPISKERQEQNLRKEINSTTYAIQQAKKEEGNNWSVKQLVIFQKNLENRLTKLANEKKKDDVIDFEDLGVDCLFVDEAHVYKNLHTVTKLKNVAGIGTSSSQRATDMKMKCEYLQEKNQGRGVIFATGTPITNSMSEFYVMQRFLQPDQLQRAGLEFFDNWAGTFGEVESTLEMTPEGGGYRMRSRFAKFHNLPELMTMFNSVADIQTAEMLNLPVPALKDGKAQIIVSECSDFQKQMMDDFVVRSEAIREGSVDPVIDNMLKLTHEAKLMAIDPRLVDESAPINEFSKINKCIENVHSIWEETKEAKSTQMIFCDSGTPKPNKFNVYDEIKSQLIQKGIPAEGIAFIHDAKTDVQRDTMFGKMRRGEIRVLLGSTSKVGTGTNVQDKLIAGHHIDCPWRPADLTQRDGRIVRQGNENKEVQIYRYVTKGTFDGYLWQIQEQKLRYISQVMTGKNISRSCDDTDETVLTAAEVKAIATDNPLLLEKMNLDNEVNRLKLVKNRWLNEKTVMENNLNKVLPLRLENYKERISNIQADIDTTNRYEEGFKMTLKGVTFTDEKEAGIQLKELVKVSPIRSEKNVVIGAYKGLDVTIHKNVFDEILIGLEGKSNHEVRFLKDEKGNILRLTNSLYDYPKKIAELENDMSTTKEQMEAIAAELQVPFQLEEELSQLLNQQTEINLKMEFEKELKVEEERENSESIPSKEDTFTIEIIDSPTKPKSKRALLGLER